MPELTGRDVHVDQLLTQMSVGYKNPAYIADELAPLVPVKKRSDIVPKYDQSHWFRNQAALRAPGTKSRRGGFSVDNTDTYYCHRYSFGFEIPDDIADNTDQPYDLDRDGVEFVTDKMQMCREVNFATNFFATSKWGTDKTGGSDFTRWSDYGGSNPLVDISSFQDTLEGKIAREGNAAVFGKQTWTQLKWHPDVIDTIKYTQKAQMTIDLFAALIEVAKVYIGRAIYTTDAMGTAEASVSYTRIWGKHGLLLYVPPRPSLMAPAAIYTFVWQRIASAFQYIKRMRNEEKEINIIEGNSYFAQKQTSSAAGLFMSTAVA